MITHHHVPTEYIHPTLAKKFFFLLSSRTKPDELSEFFYGLGVSDEYIIVGPEGFRLFKKFNNTEKLHSALKDGRFLIAESVDGRLVIKTDPMGTNLLYFWRDGAAWVLSNSLYILAREIEYLGYYAEFNPSPIAIFSFGKNDRDNGQIVSRNTPVKAAVLLCPNEYVVISSDGQKVHAEVQQSLRVSPGVRSRESYRVNLLGFIERWRSIFFSLRNKDYPIKLNLSGGKDSRAIMAIMKSVAGNDVWAETKQEISEDYSIAARIIEEHAKPGNKVEDKAKKVTDSEKFALHVMAGAGVQRFSLKAIFSSRSNQFLFTGGAAFDNASFRSTLLRRIENARRTALVNNDIIRDQVASEYECGASDWPCSIEDREAILYHYASYRCRFHYGMRHLYSRENALMPFVSEDALKLCLSVPNFSYVAKSGINFDIINICAPELLNYPFTGSQERPELLSGHLDLNDLAPPEPLEVYCGKKESLTNYVSTNGPTGEQIIDAKLEESISRFSDYFADYLPEAARAEVTSNSRLSARRNSAFLVGLGLLFPA